MWSGRERSRRWWRRVVALGVCLVALVGFVPAPAAQAVVSVEPDVPRLRVGSLPTLPYVDWPNRTIVDGSRRVSIKGIQARVIELHKVDGGYLLRRELVRYPRQEDLVFVATNGDRRSIAKLFWRGAIKVSKDGSKVVVNRSRMVGGVAEYADTAVLALPSTKLLWAQDFGTFEPGLHLYGTDRVLVTMASSELGYTGITWWTPATGALETVWRAASIESADLSAWQWAVRPRDGVNTYGVSRIPPKSGPSWEITQEDARLGTWSTDYLLIWGTDEVTDREEGYGSGDYYVYRASDGTILLGIRNVVDPWATWESETALLLRAAYWTGNTLNHQLIRCRLSGACSRVGPPSSDGFLAILPATRRG